MVEHNKAFADAKSDEEKEKIVSAFSMLYQNVLKMQLNDALFEVKSLGSAEGSKAEYYYRAENLQ